MGSIWRRRAGLASSAIVVAMSLGACGRGYVAPTTAGLTRTGLADQRAHRVAGAEESYRAALALDPNYVPAMMGLAEIAAPTTPIESVALLDQAVAVAPRYAPSHHLLGVILISIGEQAAGHRQLEIAARLGRAAAS